MDKGTLSNYGWVVIITLVLAVMLSIATPLGDYVGMAVVSTVKSYSKTNNKALKDSNIDKMGDEWADKLAGDTSDDFPPPEDMTIPEPLTRPEETLTPTEETTEEPAVNIPSVNPKNNVLTIYYVVGPNDLLGDGFINKNGLIHKVDANGTATLYKQTVRYGQELPNGLADAEDLELYNKNNLLFSGWRLSNTANAPILSTTTKYKPEDLTDSIRLGDREIYLEPVWTSQISIHFKIPANIQIYNSEYSTNANGMLTYRFPGQSVKKDYVMIINEDNTVTLPDNTKLTEIVLPDGGTNGINLWRDIDSEFAYWTINGQEVKNTNLTRAQLLTLSGGSNKIIIEPYFVQVWF